MSHDQDGARRQDGPNTEERQPQPAGTNLEARVGEDIAGVQGSPSPEEDEPNAVDPKGFETPADEPAPDAGEIEWAGQVVKKPPAPGG